MISRDPPISKCRDLSTTIGLGRRRRRANSSPESVPSDGDSD